MATKKLWPPRNYGHQEIMATIQPLKQACRITHIVLYNTLLFHGSSNTHTYLLYAWVGFGHVKLNLSHITQWTSLDHHTSKAHRHATHNYPSIYLCSSESLDISQFESVSHAGLSVYTTWVPS